jgi:hypothetical protein
MSPPARVKLRSVVELAGAAGVILGLVFVGLELRQNTAVSSAQAVLDLNGIGSEIHLALAQDADLERLVHAGYEDPNSLTEDERRRFVRWLRVRINAYEVAWMYQREGLLTRAEAAGYRSATCEILGREGARWFWEAELGNYAQGFVEDVNAWCSGTP